MLEDMSTYFCRKKIILMKRLALLLFSIIALTSISFGYGGIQGTVRDGKTKESIVGATVYIAGTSIGVSTDLEGKYLLDNLKPGFYKVIVSFISYKSDTISGVKVENEKTTQLDVYLQEVTTQLSGVTVQGRKRTSTEVSMITAIKQSNQIVVGVSSQLIAKSQDKDASEVIRRLPGVTITDGRFVIVRGLVERYNSVWLNNSPAPSTETDKRAFSFDVIPSNLINNILIFKTPAPEIPADFAGAHIQIFTKNMPDANKISVGYTATFNETSSFQNFRYQKKGKTEWLGFDDGTHALPNIVPSTLEMKEIMDYNSELIDSTTSAYRKNRMVEISRSFNDNALILEKIALPDHKLNIDMTRLFKLGNVKIGNITTFNYKTNHDITDIYRSGVESYGTSTEGILYSENLYDKRYSQSAQLGFLHNWSVSFGRNNIEFRNLLNQTGTSMVTERNGLNHYRGDQKVYKTDLGYKSRTIYTGNLNGDHQLNDKNNINWVLGYSFANMSEPDHTLISYFASVKDPDSNTYYPYYLDYNTQVSSSGNSKLFSQVRENIFNEGVNYKSILNLGNFVPEIRVGAFAETKKRSFYIRPFGVVWSRPTPNNNLLDMPIDSVYADANFNFENNGVIFREDIKDTYEYYVNTNLVAAYLSLKIPVTSFISVYGGIRAEKYKFKLSGPDYTEYNIETDTLDWFPSVGLTFNLNSKNLIRLAYGKTLNRPEFREKTQFAFYDFEENVIVYGNDTLKSCYINNYDVRYEWYPSPGELVTVGAFYKEFKNPIEATWLPVSSGGWDLKYLNAKKATSLGVEVDIRKNLISLENQGNFLRYFKNFTIVANASYIRSRVENDSSLLFLRDLKRPMYGQSPFIVNVGLYYQSEAQGLSVNLLYNVIGKRIQGIGTTDTPNTYEMPRHTLDLTLSKQLNKNLTLRLGIKDLINQKVIFSQTFTSETITEDQIIEVKSYRPSRSYAIGLSYSF
jgi:outer membrane receptor protein involved in Fe transport